MNIRLRKWIIGGNMIFLGKILTEIINEWYGQLENYWLRKDGKAVKVNNHESHATLLSKFNHEQRDKAYAWMYHNGWARIIIERGDMYIQTDYDKPQKVNLTTEQKAWITDKIYLYPKDENGEDLRPVNIYGKSVTL
jgi:hypothetical protein